MPNYLKTICITIFFCILLSACKKKDNPVTPSEPVFTNKLINENGSVSFQRLISTTKGLSFNSVKQAPDSGFIVCGNTLNDQNLSECLFLKLNKKGEIVWQKTFNDGSNDYGGYIEIANDGGFIAAFSSQPAVEHVPAKNVVLLKLDVNGNILWNKYLGTNMSDPVSIIKLTSGYIIGGSGIIDQDGELVATDNTGNILWDSRYYSQRFSKLTSFCKTDDQGYMLAGNIFGVFSLMKVNSKGDSLWTKRPLDSNWTIPRSIRKMPSGNFAICGSWQNIRSGLSGCFYRVVDVNGDYISTSIFPGLNLTYLNNLNNVSDGNLILTSLSNNSAYLMKATPSGSIIWKHSYDDLNEVWETYDKGFIAVSGGEQHLYSNSKGYIVKTDANGN